MPCTPGCGSCCDPISLTENMVSLLTDPNRNPEPVSNAFILDNWAPREPRPGDTITWFDCFVYDVEHRTCGDYDNRPPVCRIYPMEGSAPGPDRLVCGYQAEMGRTVLPIVEVR